MNELKTSTDMITAARREGDAIFATVLGEVDLSNSPELRVGLLELIQIKPPKRLILNLAAVPYMDSSAIAVLVETLKKLRVGGGKMVLLSLQPRVKGLLEIARLDSIFPVAKDEVDALTK